MELTLLWFIAIAVLFIGYFVLEGFDFGVGILMPIIGRRGRTPEEKEARRRVVLNTIGPVWDGNEVWLITAGGALFAAFPEWYATLFSGFYLPLLLILIALIARICAIEWRGKINSDRWRYWADMGIGLGSWLPAILWGVAFANIVNGVAIDADRKYVGGFFALLNPYALLGGLTTLSLFIFHGAVFLALKTAGEVRVEALAIARLMIAPVLVISGSWLLWTGFNAGEAVVWALIAAAVVALLIASAMVIIDSEGWAFLATVSTLILAFSAVFVALYPNVMPSTIDPAYSLTVENASSSHYTLVVMTWAAAFMLPIVLAYQGWTYWVFRKRLSIEQIPPSIGLSPQSPGTATSPGTQSATTP
ncbi:cytochrome d ubiquinol oxidase subunit II [Millisia brevis]|uniref:cytochrome d ubiquinol oxidase subunit II n=1 Tax=Millisia brevis TaxID=264148 RepID=UPI00082C4EFF|nr:cytochrome d ubiquinol oxidase subunit II [Millisia brevis]